MRLCFRQSAPLPAVRGFLAELVRLVRPELAGDWALASTSSPPQPDSSDSLERSEWRLGDATLVQTIDRHGGSPREADSFSTALTASVRGGDGAAREVLLQDPSGGPDSVVLDVTLENFTVDEFLAARRAARARFANDESASPMAVRGTLQKFIAQGARTAARTLTLEALDHPGHSFDAYARRELRGTLLELTDDPAARLVIEGDLLLTDPADVERLARLASGALALPQWTPRAAAQVLAVMEPWRPSAATELGDVSRRWVEHPWWRPRQGSQLAGWSAVRRQHFARGPDGSLHRLVPDGEPRRLSADDVLDAVQKTLKVGDVNPAPPRTSEGRILSLEGERPLVRAVAHLRTRDGDVEHHWTWVWTGVGLEGAVVVSRLEAPFERGGQPVETHLAWLGGAAASARFEKAFLDAHETLRLAPAVTSV